MIKVGVCSNPTRRIFEEFELLEVQKTFYQIVREETVKKWRERAPEGFEFVPKCFQGITHPSRSPTWKKSNVNVSEIKEKVGYLKLNDKTLEFWDHMLKICKILGSKVMLVQLPASFRDTDENVRIVQKFFGSVERDSINIAVEFRGWREEKIREVCKDLDLVDVFDPLQRKGFSEDIWYIRLHGRVEGGRINYKHKYSEEELKEIARKIEEGPEEIYILFNNVYMLEDAKRFLEILKNW